MTLGSRSVRSAMLALVLAVAFPRHAAATWTPDGRGACAYHLDGASLLRGPTAILNAPLVPFRAVAGGVTYAREHQTNRMPGIVLLPPTLVVTAGAMGVAQMLIWVGTGLFDTVTAGYFEAAPPEATRLAVDPLPPLFSDTPRAAGTNPCGHAGQ